MYSALIVDDDKNIRERIINRVPWNNLGIGDISEAEDSESALNVFFEHRPNIVITDIRIPTRSGLEVARDMYALDHDVQIIAITGFQDFEMAQKAVALGVLNLIKKPLSMDELTEAISKAMSRLDELRLQRQNSEELAGLLERSMPSLHERFFGAWLGGSKAYETEAELRHKAAELRIELSSPLYGAAVSLPQNMPADEGELRVELAAIKNIADELLREADIEVAASYADAGQHVFLLGVNDGDGWDRAEDVFSNLFIKFNFYFGVNVISGLGSLQQDIMALPASLADARGALFYHRLFGNNGVVNVKNVIRMENPFLSEGRRAMEDAIAAFVACNEAYFYEKLTQFLEQAAYVSLGNLDVIKQLLNELCIVVMRHAIQAGVKPDAFTGDSSPYLRLTAIKSATEAHAWVRMFCGSLFELMETQYHKKENHIIKLATDYIAARFTEESLSMAEVCAHVQLSPGYFSRLFRQETGASFNEHLNSVRLERAKKLLRESTMKIYEVAHTVGYGNPKYFNHVFKNATGLPPLDYRNGAQPVAPPPENHTNGPKI